MCNFIATNHVRCGHKTTSIIRCPTYEAKPRKQCKKNYYQPFEHSLCPKCGGPPINKYPKAETMAQAATVTRDDSESRRGIMRSSLSSQTTLPDLSRAFASSSASFSTAKKEKRNMFNLFRRGSDKVKERKGTKEGGLSRGSSFSRGKRGSVDLEVGVEREDFGISRPSISISVSTPAETEFDIGAKGKADRPWTEAKTFVKEPDEMSPVTRIESTRSEGWTDASFGTSYQSTSYLELTRGSAVDDEGVGDGRDMTSLERANEYRDLIGEHPLEAGWREEFALAEEREAETVAQMWAEDAGRAARENRADEEARETQRREEEYDIAESARRELEDQAKARRKAKEEAEAETSRQEMGMKPWEDAKSRKNDRDTVMSNQTTWSKLITQAAETPLIPRVEMAKNLDRKKIEVQTSPVSANSLKGSIDGSSTPATPKTPRTPVTPAPFVLPSTLPSKSNSLGAIVEGNQEEIPATQLSKSLSLKTIPESKSSDTKPEPKSSLLGRILSKKEPQKGPIKPGPPTDFRHIQHTRPEDVTSSPDSKHSISLSEDQAFLMAKERLNKLHHSRHRHSAEKALEKSQLRISSERERIDTRHSLEEGKSRMYKPGEIEEVSQLDKGKENGEDNPKTYRGDAISGFSQHNDTAYESWRTEAKAESQFGKSGDREKERGSPRPPPSPSTPTTMPKGFGLLTSNSTRPPPPPPTPMRNITNPLLSSSIVPLAASLPPTSTLMRNITHPLPSSSRAPPSSSPLLRVPPLGTNPFSSRAPINPSTYPPPPSSRSSKPTTPDPFTPQLQVPKIRGLTESLLAADKRVAVASHARGGMNPPTESFIEARERTRMRPCVIPDRIDNFRGAARR